MANGLPDPERDRAMNDLPTVFIQTNAKQFVGAVVAAHALRRSSAQPDRFAVKVLHTDDFPFLRAYEGETYTFGGSPRVWRNDDLQSFTPLRFAPPQQMGYRGRAVVIDPDVFAVGDVNELFDRDMNGKAILCRRRPAKPHRPGYLASSVMLLDCAKLRHWRVEENFAELFDGRRDYKRWMQLELEPADSIGLFEPEWNDFDHLTADTKMLHTTKRRTQPWKTGLPVDFRINAPVFGVIPQSLIRTLRRSVAGEETYAPHPDRHQEDLFFGLLRECLADGLISEEQLRGEIAARHVRADAFEVLDRVPSLPAPPARVESASHASSHSVCS
jgi:hypothetical protein